MSPQESSRASTPTAVVTGATGGIGEAITRRLAAEGMSVRMVGRSAERLERAAQRVRTAVPGADLHLERADLSLIANVRDLAARIGDGPPPDAVVSNAAVAQDVGRTTPEGLPEMLAVNHLAPYLLLRSLIRPLAGRASRFVVVGADPTWLARVPVDLDDLEFRRARGLGPIPSFRPFVGYGKTKNMNTMFVYSLARHLQGTRITVNGAHPGIIADTGLGRHARGALRLFTRVLDLFVRPPGPSAGADTPAWLATSPEVAGVTGRFFVKRQQVPTAPHTTDIARCDRLWEESARLVGLPPEA